MTYFFGIFVCLQVDLMMRCIYGIVHPDDHEELKMVLEQSLSPSNLVKPTQVNIYNKLYFFPHKMSPEVRITAL